MTTLTSNLLVVISILGLVLAMGCGLDEGSAGPVSGAATAAESNSSATNARDVSRVVFVDQEQACECTQNRISASWTALQTVVGGREDLPVERIHRDTQEQQAEAYRALRPMVTVPGIYLLDGEGAVVELLQGEVTEEQLRQALGRRS